MSKASQGIKLIKWLASQGDDVVTSADDLKRFGPQAAKVRALLDFIPTMSDDAVQTSRYALDAADDAAYEAADSAAYEAAYDIADSAAYNAADDAAYNAAYDAAGDAAYDIAFPIAGGAAFGAASRAAHGELVGKLISPENYRILTNPLAAGRAVDVLGSRPRNQGLPFLDVVRQMRERSAIRNPRDVVVGSRLAKVPKDILETALTLMSDGMSAEDAMRAARLL